MWWLLEIIVWYLFIYAIFFTIKTEAVSLGWMSLVILFLGSLGILANPLTRHMSVWNKILDRVIRKEEEEKRY